MRANLEQSGDCMLTGEWLITIINYKNVFPYFHRASQRCFTICNTIQCGRANIEK